MPSEDPPWYLRCDATSSYDSWYEGKGKRADILEKQLLKDLLDYVGRGHTILEVGVGTAHFARWFESLGIQCVGLDLSTLMLKEAKKLWQGGSVIRGDAHHLPFRGKTFDLVAFITCMEFLRSPIDALKEARDVSKNGLLLGMLNKWSLLTLSRNLQATFGKRNQFFSTARFFSIKDAKNMVSEALNGIEYSTKWSTTLYPRMLLPEQSRFPFGAFLGFAAKFIRS